MRALRVLAVGLAGLVVGCSNAGSAAPHSPSSTPTPTASDSAVVTIRKVRRLPPNGQLDDQIGGAYEPS